MQKSNKNNQLHMLSYATFIKMTKKMKPKVKVKVKLVENSLKKQGQAIRNLVKKSTQNC